MSDVNRPAITKQYEEGVHKATAFLHQTIQENEIEVRKLTEEIDSLQSDLDRLMARRAVIRSTSDALRKVCAQHGSEYVEAGDPEDGPHAFGRPDPERHSGRGRAYDDGVG